MSDPYYANVSLLLHCDGSNGSTTFTDNSPSPKTAIVSGNASLSNLQSHSGGTSCRLDGAGDSISFADHADFAFGTGDFTIEFWIYPLAVSSFYGLLTKAGSTGTSPFLLHLNAGTLRLYLSANGSTWDIVNGGVIGSISVNTPYHIAVTRSGTTFRSFRNGVLGWNGTSSLSLYDSPNPLRIGCNFGAAGEAQFFNGYIDEVRLTKGVARYTANFTPPTDAFSNSGVDPLIPVIGTMAVTGQTPSIAAGQQLTPSVGQMTITGLIASLPSPDMGTVALTGQIPALSAGFADTPALGQALLTGQAPALGLGWSSAPAIGQAALTGLTPQHSAYTFYGWPSAAELAFDGFQPDLIVGFAGTAVQRQITESGQTPSFVNRLLYAIAGQWISTHYRCYLTGAADALTDLELPISSFQTRLAASPVPRAYLAVIVPGVDSYIDAINARANGRLKVDRIYNYLDGSLSTFQMANVPFDTLNTNQGGRSGMTGTLTGFEETGAITAQAITLADPATRSSDNGGIRYRCRLDPRVRPDDTVTINGETFAVESVIHIVDAKTAIMEVKEKL
jgi:hypothetical protein